MPSLVSDVMTRNVISVRERAQFKEIILVMREHGFSAFPVLDPDDTVVGVVSEDDLLVKEAHGGPKGTSGFLARLLDQPKATGLCAGELMTHPAMVIRPDATVAEAAHIMHARHVKRLPVVTADGTLVGIVSRVDLLGVYDRPDSEIQSEILKSVIDDEFVLDSRPFTVKVAAGIATVSGVISSASAAGNLLDAIRQVRGVVAVRDRLSYPKS